MRTKNARAIDADESAWLADVKCLTESCDRKVVARGLCQTCYVRLRRRGEIDRLKRPSPQEYVCRNSKQNSDGCWIWQLKVCSRTGYGIASYQNRRWKAHRFSFDAFNGRIENGMQVNHKCHVRSCVNPDHIYLGTQLDNMRDMRLAGRSGQPNGEHAGNAKLTEENVREILSSKESHREIQRRFGISHSNVLAIRKRLTWKHVNAQ